MHSNNIGTLRFLGAFFVLFGHGYSLCAGKRALDPLSALLVAYSPFHKALPGIGVMLFFVLSGYLITASFLKRNDWLDFTVARILRIYPALIVAVLFCVFIVGLHVTTLPTSEYLAHKETINFILHNCSLLFLHFNLPGVFLDLPWKNNINGSLWTLPIELSMYLLVAIIGIAGVLRDSRLFNVLCVVFILAFIANPKQFLLLNTPGDVYLGLSFLLGAFFCVNKNSIKLTAPGLLLCLVPCLVTFKTPYYNFFALVFFSYAVLYIGLHERIRLPALDRYGDFSYGLYLYAFPFQQLSIFYLGTESPLLINATAFLGAMLLSITSWFLVEKPALAYKSQLTLKLYHLKRLLSFKQNQVSN